MLLPEAVGGRIAGAMSAFTLGECFAVCRPAVPIGYNIPVHSEAKCETGHGYDDESLRWLTSYRTSGQVHVVVCPISAGVRVSSGYPK